MNFLIRTATAVVYAAVLLFCMQKGDIWFLGLFGLCTVLATAEFSGLANRYRQAGTSRLWSVLAALSFYVAVAMAPVQSDMTFIPFIVCVMVIFILELYRKQESPLRSMAYTLLPVLYIALPFSLLSLLGYGIFAEGYNPAVPVALFIFLWCNDVGAYCTGCTIGRHKLFERVSPKKTWEGSAGGAVLTVAGAVVLTKCLPDIYGAAPLRVWIGMALTVVLFGTWGDLIESLMKREMGIKDSGRILPGHGGMLDRFDSTLLATPAVLVYFCIVMKLLK